jgi:ABC-2 type transport system permease protein
VNAALEFELLKARRSPVFRWGLLGVALGVPAVTTLFVVLVAYGGSSPAAAKAATLVTDLSVAGMVVVAGQVLTVAMLLAAGLAASWSFGREFVDDAVPALFALATPLRSVVAAKFTVLTGWAAMTVVSTVAVTVVAALALGLPPSPDVVRVLAQATTAGFLSAVLAWPLALVASWRRGYLAGFVALVLIVVVTQLVTAVGAGGWFPFAAPSLWMGMGGPEAAAGITALQLAAAPVVAAAAVVASRAWWERAETR